MAIKDEGRRKGGGEGIAGQVFNGVGCKNIVDAVFLLSIQFPEGTGV